jgi:hypothetical protein
LTPGFRIFCCPGDETVVGVDRPADTAADDVLVSSNLFSAVFESPVAADFSDDEI